MDTKFCERVEKLAKQHGYHSTKTILEECEISFAAYYKWKRGENGCPSADQVMKLAEKLHTSVEWLMKGTRPVNAGDMHKINRLTEQVQELCQEIKKLTTIL